MGENDPGMRFGRLDCVPRGGPRPRGAKGIFRKRGTKNPRPKTALLGPSTLGFCAGLWDREALSPPPTMEVPFSLHFPLLLLFLAGWAFRVSPGVAEKSGPPNPPESRPVLFFSKKPIQGINVGMRWMKGRRTARLRSWAGPIHPASPPSFDSTRAKSIQRKCFQRARGILKIQRSADLKSGSTPPPGARMKPRGLSFFVAKRTLRRNGRRKPGFSNKNKHPCRGQSTTLRAGDNWESGKDLNRTTFSEPSVPRRARWAKAPLQPANPGKEGPTNQPAAWPPPSPTTEKNPPVPPPIPEAQAASPQRHPSRGLPPQKTSGPPPGPRKPGRQ